MCKIEIKNYDGKIIEVEVSNEIYEFHNKNFWQEDWRNRKRKKENDLDSVYENPNLFYTLPKELRESTEESYIKKFETERLRNAIESLPEKQKRRLILHFFAGLTFSQIAKVENCSESSVKTLVNRALQSLKKFFKKI